MSRPPLEVADLIRSAGAAFIERNRQWLSWKHIKVLLAIARCRTAALGGHLDQCTRCGHRATIDTSRGELFTQALGAASGPATFICPRFNTSMTRGKLVRKRPTSHLVITGQ